MKTHNALLSGPEGSLQEALFGVCGEVEEHQAAPQTVPGLVNTLCAVFFLPLAQDDRGQAKWTTIISYEHCTESVQA